LSNSLPGVEEFLGSSPLSVEQPFILVKLFGTAAVSGHGVVSDLEVG